jgi:hypothetical protein
MKRQEVGEKCIMRSFITCTLLQVHIIRMIKSGKMGWAGHVARIEEILNDIRYWRENQKEIDQ